MAELTLESLGITSEALVDRVVDKLVDLFLDGDDGFEEESRVASITKAVNNRIEEGVAASVQQICETHILPKVQQMIADLVIQETNRYGEQKGKPMSLVEFATNKAEDYLLMNVDYSGKDERGRNDYGWKPTQTRLCHLIKEHLHYEIDRGVKEAMTDATKHIGKALAETARLKLAEAAASLSVTTAIKG